MFPIKSNLITVVILILSLCLLWECSSINAASGEKLRTFEPTWESLSQHEVPEWFKDAKFGIYAHWGVYSVPAFGSEWYPRNMYRKDSSTYKHHQETFGPLEEFGYKDFVPMFKAEKFNAEQWASLYEKAGAKFGGPVAEHHDGFSMWDSKVNRWNVAQMGPKRDITAELVEALRKRNIKIITSFHHAFNIQGYYTAEQGWDTADSKYGDLYGKFKDPKEAHERWFLKIKEVIDAYQPDQIWFDFGLAKIPDEYKIRMAAYYYNHEAKWGKPVIITRKGNHLPEGVGALDIERGKMDKLAPVLWQTDDSLAVNSWCWVKNLKLKPSEELVHEIIDIVSKNGVLLLNICPKADGTIPDDQEQQLLEIGNWLKVNGEAIYATRPWKAHGQGPNLFDKGRGFHRDAVRFNWRDIRYTQSKDHQTLYAIALGWPEKELTLDLVKVNNRTAGAAVSLLGYDKPIKYHLNDEQQIVIDVPALKPRQRPCKHAYSFKLSGFELALHPDALFTSGAGIFLPADRAVREGDQLILEDKIKDRQNIGAWGNPKERVHWLVSIPQAGIYAIRGEFAAAEGTSRLTVDVAGQSIPFDVPRTGGWDKSTMVKIGQLQFDQPGVYHLILRPADPTDWKAVNLWQLQLAPAP